MLLEIATRVLVASPAASLGEVAAAGGVSRTTLHSRFPTRQALLVALAHKAMDLVAAAYEQARTEHGTPREALLRVVELMVPLGPRTEFLLRERSLDDDEGLGARYAVLDAPLLALVERGQRSGELRVDLPAGWVVAALAGTVYTAWEAIAEGRLAPREAPALIVGVVLDGVVPR